MGWAAMLSLIGDLGLSGFVGEVGVAAMISVVIGVSSFGPPSEVEAAPFASGRRDRRPELRGMD